ncbi:gp436 family protein [Psychrobacter sp. T6-1]|uniref:gp436 family protein n=1 Tax=Psychrobacter sp. T6-1 TaxID=3457447 RepID=UPI003FD680C9
MITLQDLIKRFGESEIAKLTDREAYQVIDESVAQTAIEDAEGEVAGYLRAAGLVTKDALGRVVYRNGAEIPDDLVRHTCNIARYNLYDNGVTETVEKRYDDAIKWLDKVKKDPTMLTGPAAPSTSTSGSIAVIPNPVPSLYQD